jgi:hypothetical protein
MPIDVICSCGRRMSVPDHFAGKSGKCKGCGARLTIPRPDEPFTFTEQDLVQAVAVRPCDPVPLAQPVGEPRPVSPAPIPPIVVATEPKHTSVYVPNKRRFALSRRAMIFTACSAVAVFILVPLVASLGRPNCHALAPDALKNGNLDAAEKYYRLGLQQAIRENAHYFIAVTHQGLADVAMAREDWATAEKEARTAFDELICPVNMQRDKFFRDIDMVKCFNTMGYAKIATGDYEKGIREVEEADMIQAEQLKGMNEPNASIRMSGLYRAIARVTGQPRYYQRALERIKRVEDGVVSFKYGSLGQTIAHSNVLKERAAIAREFAIPGENPVAIEEEANRMEKAFLDKEKSDQERHGIAR